MIRTTVLLTAQQLAGLRKTAKADPTGTSQCALIRKYITAGLTADAAKK
jgi:hypothetical protein